MVLFINMRKRCFYENCMKELNLKCNCEDGDVFMCYEHSAYHLNLDRRHKVTSTFNILKPEETLIVIELITYKLKVYTDLESTIVKKVDKIVSEIYSSLKNALSEISKTKRNIMNIFRDLQANSIDKEDLSQCLKETAYDFVIDYDFLPSDNIMSAINEFFSKPFEKFIKKIPNFSLKNKLDKNILVSSKSLSPEKIDFDVSPIKIKENLNTSDKLSIIKEENGLDIWHPGDVNCMELTSDGKVIVSGGNKVIILWDAITGEIISYVDEAHTEIVKSIAITSDSYLFVSISSDNLIKLWKLSGPSPIKMFKSKYDITCIQISYDNNICVLGTNKGSLLLMNMKDTSDIVEIEMTLYWGEWTKISTYNKSINNLRLNHKNMLAVTSHENGALVVWNLIKKTVTKQIDNLTPVTSLEMKFNQDFFIYSTKNVIKIYNFNKKKDEKLVCSSGEIYCLALSADNNTILSGGEDPSIQIWSVTNLANTGYLAGHKKSVNIVKFFDDNVSATSCSKDGIVIIWDVNLKTRLVELDHHKAQINNLIAMEDIVVSSSKDGIINVHRRLGRNNNLCLTGHRGTVQHVIVSENKKYVYSAGSDGTVRKWSIDNRKQIYKLLQIDTRKGYFFIDRLLLSDDEKYIYAASSYDKMIIIYDLDEKCIEKKIMNACSLASEEVTYKKLKNFKAFFN